MTRHIVVYLFLYDIERVFLTRQKQRVILLPNAYDDNTTYFYALYFPTRFNFGIVRLDGILERVRDASGVIFFNDLFHVDV